MALEKSRIGCERSEDLVGRARPDLFENEYAKKAEKRHEGVRG
jgi:hypothetical protein